MMLKEKLHWNIKKHCVNDLIIFMRQIKTSDLEWCGFTEEDVSKLKAMYEICGIFLSSIHKMKIRRK